MTIPATAKGIGDIRKLRLPLATALDALEVEDAGHWVKRVPYTNPIPNAIRCAQRRNPGRTYVWDHEADGIRVWRKT